MKNDPSLSEASQTILVVDDLPEILQFLGGMLKQSGYKVRPVTSGKLAIQAATLEPPDLVLLDVQMPDMNGYEVCKQLKAIPALDDIPVIFVSGLTEVIDKVQAFSVGGVDYVTKPFQLEEVEARVRTHLDLRRQKHQLRESYSQLRILEELRDDLVHMIVHDMGSPLMAVQVFLELIGRAGEDFPQHVQGHVQKAKECTATLIEMVGSVLDVSKMESGEMKLELDTRRRNRKLGLGHGNLSAESPNE